MRLDHIVFAAGPGGLAGTSKRLSELLGEPFATGGVHPRFGTRNAILPLTDGTYFEIVEVLDHPASDKAPFGQAVRARSALGGGWMGWVVAVDDIAPFEERLGREAVNGNRHRPDGVELLWRQLGVKGLQADPQLPFFVQWNIEPGDHPSVGATGSGLAGVPRDRRRPGPRLGLAGRVGRPAPRGREGRVGGPQRHPRHRRREVPDALRRRPDLTQPARAASFATGRPAEPEHLAPPAGLRDREPRGRPRRRAHRADRVPRPLGRSRRPRRRLRDRLPPPAVRRDRPYRHRGRAAPRPRGDRPTPDPPARQRHRARRIGDLAPLAGGLRGRDARALGVLLRTRLRARARRARPGDAPRGPCVRHRQRPTRSTFGGWFRRGYPDVDPRVVEVLAGPGLGAASDRDRVDVRLARGPRGRRTHRVQRRRSPRRSWPGTTAPRSTTRSTCGAAATDRVRGSGVSSRAGWSGVRRARAQHPALVGERLVREHGVQDPHQLHGHLLQRLAHRGQAGPGHLRGERVVEADDADVAPGSSPRSATRAARRWRGCRWRTRPPVIEGSSSRSCVAIRAASTLSVSRTPSPVRVEPGRAHRRLPAAAPVLADAAGLLPAEPGDPLVALLQQVLGREPGPVGAVDVDPRVVGVRARPTVGRR